MMNDEPIKNEQSDQSFPERRAENSRSHQNPSDPQMPDPEKKQIPSFEEIMADQRESMSISGADTEADTDSDDQIDPLESLNELKSAISKTQATLSSEEIDGLLGDQQIDNIEEDHASENTREDDLGAEDEMDALASLKAAIQRAQSQLDQDDINDGDQNNTGSFNISNGQDVKPPIKPENENSLSPSSIPSFELA